jgi:hypothetical protein
MQEWQYGHAFDRHAASTLDLLALDLTGLVLPKWAH